MTNAERTALDVLAKSAEVYNCWSILDNSSAYDENLAREYAESGRRMLMNSIENAALALTRLGKEYGIDVDVLIGMSWEAK